MRVLNVALAAALALSVCAPATAVASVPSTKGSVIPGYDRLVESHPGGVTRTVTKPASAGEARYVPGMYVVQVAPTQRAAVTDSIESSTIRGDVKRVNADGDTMLVALPSDTAATRTRLVSGVTSVSRSVRMRPYGALEPADPGYASQWSLARVGAQAAWTRTRGAGVTIAVVDTGVDVRNADLVDNLLPGYDVLTEGAGLPKDSVGHGTHVAGIAAASMNDTGVVGIAPEASILPVRVMEGDWGGTDMDVATGITWAADNGADIINLSLGSDEPSMVVIDAILDAQSKGVLIVAAAGNQGGRVSFPATLPGVIAVGSTSMNDKVSGFSNGDHTLSLSAPGESIISDRVGGGTLVADGTSMASPLVAGAAALLLADDPTLSPDEVKDRLEQSACDLGTGGYDLQYGWGRLNIAAAFGLPGGAAVASVDGDDEVPGVEATSSPIVGTLDESTDTRDVRRFHLKAGQRLLAKLTTTSYSYPWPAFEEGLYLLPGDTTNVSSGERLLSASDFRFDYYEPMGGASTTLDFVAAREGDYYMPLQISEGVAAYKLDWSITTAPASDNYGAGLPLKTTPLVGSVNDFTDPADIFYIDLMKGQRFCAWSASSSSDELLVSLATVGPDAWSAFTPDEYMFGDGGTGFEYEVGDASEIVAPADGRYLLRITSGDAGYSSYRINWKVTTPTVDDSLPGVPMPMSVTAPGSFEATGQVSYPTDRHDIWSLPANKGERINVWSSTNGAPAIVAIASPRSVSLEKAAFLGGSVMGATSLTAPEDGVYYVVVTTLPFTDVGTTSYRLGASVLPGASPSVAATPSATEVAYNATPKASVTVTDSVSGLPLADQAVNLCAWDRTYSEWYPVAAARTAADGSVTLAGYPISATTKYRVELYDGDTLTAGPEFSVRPRAYLGAPKPSARVYANRAITWKGSIKPKHAKYAKDVTFIVQKKSGTAYVPYKTISAPISVSGSTSTFAGKITLPKGTWRVIARHAADADNGESFSSATTITVK